MTSREESEELRVTCKPLRESMKTDWETRGRLSITSKATWSHWRKALMTAVMKESRSMIRSKPLRDKTKRGLERYITQLEILSQLDFITTSWEEKSINFIRKSLKVMMSEKDNKQVFSKQKMTTETKRRKLKIRSLESKSLTAKSEHWMTESKQFRMLLTIEFSISIKLTRSSILWLERAIK